MRREVRSAGGPLNQSMSDEIASNRKARRDYHIADTYEAGVELKGTEVKSVRAGKANISDAYARVEKGQVLQPALGQA